MKNPSRKGDDKLPNDWKRGLVLTALTILAYLPALRAGYVWDDDVYVTRNPTLQTADGLADIWFHPRANTQYYPLVFTGWWIEYHCWELRPFGYHMVNVLLHALNAILLWRFLAGLRIPGAWLASAIFALHPLHVESVAWVTERKDVLSGMFALLTLICWKRFIQEDRKRDYALALFLFACALLSKAAVLPLAAVLFLMARGFRISLENRIFLPTIPFLVLSFGMALLHVWVEQGNLNIARDQLNIAPADRILIAGRALWFYIGKLLWPSNLMTIYPRWEIGSLFRSSWLYSFAAFGAGGAFGILQRNSGKLMGDPEVRTPTASRIEAQGYREAATLGHPNNQPNPNGVAPLSIFVAGLVLFALMIAPALGLVMGAFYRFSFVADHFQYLAGIGIIVPSAMLFSMITDRPPLCRRAFGAAAKIALVVMLGVLTWRHSATYQDSRTLWEDNLAKNPNASVAHNHLGVFCLQEGKTEEAVSHFQRAISAWPGYKEAHNNLGVALGREGKFGEAIQHYREALRLDPDYAEAQWNLNRALKRVDKD